MTFDELNLHPSIGKAVSACGFTSPTPIQAKAIPPAMNGGDVMGLAQTGTGKTAAFMLPILQRLTKGPRGRVRALVIAPTRELAGQINDSVRELGGPRAPKSVEIYGGVGMNPQIQAIRRGAEIVVACPGRLLDHLRNGNIDLSRIDVLVLDEADRMLDMGFLPDIRSIIGYLPSERQTMLFSATMPNDIRKLANDILRKPTTVQVDFEAPAASVSHALYPVSQHLKSGLLFELLKNTETESVLIFTRTKHRAKKLAIQLGRKGYSAAALQGDMPQTKRQQAIDGFKGGRYSIMVATDIAARGIDVSNISHVINFDMPDTVDAYTHRIGRTGRAAKTGEAFTLVTPEDGLMVRTIEKMLGARPRMIKVDGFDYGTPAPERTGNNNRKTAASGVKKSRPVATSGEWKDNKRSTSRWEGKKSDRPRSDQPKGGRSDNGWASKSDGYRGNGGGGSRPKRTGRPNSYGR